MRPKATIFVFFMCHSLQLIVYKKRIFAYVYIINYLNKIKNKKKKHVEIHTCACVVEDTLSCDREAGDPFRRDLPVFLGTTFITGSYTYI